MKNYRRLSLLVHTFLVLVDQSTGLREISRTVAAEVEYLIDKSNEQWRRDQEKLKAVDILQTSIFCHGDCCSISKFKLNI